MYQIISSMNNNVTLAQDVNGEEVYTLYDQGEGNSPILTLTVD